MSATFPWSSVDPVHNVEPVTPRLCRIMLVSVALVGCGGDEDRPATWSYISPGIIQPNCATSSCHSRGAAVSGLDLSTAKAGYDSLFNQKLAPQPLIPARQMVTRRLVTPFSPTESRVVNMLRAYGASRMPPDRPLAEADIALIEEWILSGAKND
jgi:hypothetical protein